jgi:hypothetical protein
MTTLNHFLNIIPPKIRIIKSFQKTPTNLYVVIDEKDFFNLIDFFSVEQMMFQFLEKKVNEELLVHFITQLNRTDIQISFNVVLSSSRFDEQFLAKFPSSAIYLQNSAIL